MVCLLPGPKSAERINETQVSVGRKDFLREDQETLPEPTVRSGRSNLTGVTGSKSPTTLITTKILTGGGNSDCNLGLAQEE
jgi:hypothetical protein